MQEIVLWLSEYGIYQIMGLLEMLMILQCMHGVFKEQFKFAIDNILLIILDLVVMVLIYFKIIGQIATCLVFIMLFVYCHQKFKRKFGETIKLFILGAVLVGAIELFSSVVVIPFTSIIENQGALMSLYNIIGLFVSIIIFKIPHIKNRKIRFDFDKEKWGILIVVSGLYILITLIDYRIHGEVNQVYGFLFLTACVLSCVVAILAQEAKHEVEKKKLELDLQEIYGDAYKELITEVRRKQHDFKNQLSAIYSMHVTASSLEELVERQREYGDILLENNRYDKILTGCNNSILAGYLYCKCVAYEQEDVQVDPQISVDSVECSLSLHEVIEILGILLTNAFEKYQTKRENKCIGLIVKDSIEKFTIEVSNESEELTSKEIEQIFSEGYSSKGLNRGIGLARVKELASSVKADLIVENRIKDNSNWISFRVVIPK